MILLLWAVLFVPPSVPSLNDTYILTLDASSAYYDTIFRFSVIVAPRDMIARASLIFESGFS
jgi:hypothetical protein